MKDFCSICGLPDEVERHHIIPRSHGGSNDGSNLITLCRLCHRIIHTGVYNPSTSDNPPLEEAKIRRLEKIRNFMKASKRVKIVIAYYSDRFHLMILPYSPTEDRYTEFVEKLNSWGQIVHGPVNEYLNSLD